MGNTPNVSIIMPTYNREKLLPKAINSVINQVYTNWELIIVDDGSTDNTRKLVDNYSRLDQRIRYIRNNRNKGPSGARNCGILQCKGEYIAFLDSDDEWFNYHLKDSIEVLENEDVCVCFALWIENRSGKLVQYDQQPGIKEQFEDAFRDLTPEIKNNLVFFDERFYEYAITTNLYCYHINTMVFKKDILHSVDLFNEKLRANEDNDFVYRVFHDFNICLILDYHFTYNQGQDNIYLFIDRTNISVEDILGNRNFIERLTFNWTHQNRLYRITKKFIKKSTRIKDKKECLRVINKYMGKKYFALGYINRETGKWKARYFYLMSLFYDYDEITLIYLAKILVPFYFNSIEVKPPYIELG